MSGCGNANCSCGSSCSCGSGCNCRSGGGFKMYPGLSEEKSTAAQTLIMDLAPSRAKGEFEEGEGSGSENGGCPCGNGCQCDPCTCNE